MNEVKKTRWRKAQKHERRHWERIANNIVNGSLRQLDWYEWKAREMEEKLWAHLDQRKWKFGNILEVGSGPVGIVSFLNYGKRYAVDPLEDFYRENPFLCKMRDPKVSYIKGNGESLPFKNNFFSLVIIDNVLDHVHNATKVLDEIYRVLSREGKLYLAINVHTIFGSVLHSVLAKLGVDKGHPYTFTVEGIRSLIHSRGFSIISEFVNDYYEAKKQNQRSCSLKNKMKAYTGLSEFIYSAVCIKR